MADTVKQAEAMIRIRRTHLSAGLLVLCSLSVQAQGWQVPKPSPGLMPNPVIGKTLFGKVCANCHGANLKGSDKGPPLLHRIYEPAHHADASFQLAAKNGVRAHHWQFGDMAPMPQVTSDDVAHITAYVRIEQRKVGIE